MPTVFHGQTQDQRKNLRRELLEFAEGTSQGPSSARFFTKQELIDFGVNDLDYPEALVRAVIRELDVQRILSFRKELTT